MIRPLLLLAFFSLTGTAFAQQSVLEAKNEKVSVRFSLSENGAPQYAIFFSDKPVIDNSTMGFSLDVDPDFYKGFRILGEAKRSVDETWRPVWGEVSTIRNRYEELKVHLVHQSGKLLDIVFRVFSDGVGFRYEFPKQHALRYFIVKDEYTSFQLTGDHKCFWIPGDFDSNEYSYTTSRI